MENTRIKTIMEMDGRESILEKDPSLRESAYINQAAIYDEDQDEDMPKNRAQMISHRS